MRRRLLEAIGPEGEPARSYGSWRSFLADIHLADCAVVVVEDLGEDGERTHLMEMKLQHRDLPIVLVTWDGRENSRLLKDVEVEEVVWLHDLSHDTPSAVERARRRTWLVRLADALERSRLPLFLRRALALASRSPEPVRTVTRLARMVGCSRATLDLQWRQALGSRPERLEDFLGWLILFRAVAMKAPGRSWATVAVALQTHEDTLRRIARRCTGIPLREIAKMPRNVLLEDFDERVLRHLLGPITNWW